MTDTTTHNNNPVSGQSPLAVDDVRAVVREELAKHIPAGVLRSNERAMIQVPYRGPLMPDEWAAAVIRHTGHEKWRLDQLSAAARGSAGADHGERDAGADPQAVEFPVDGGLEPVSRADSIVDRGGSGQQSVGVEVADGVLGSVVDQSGHDASPSVDGCGDLTVGEGQVAGVEHTAPATEVPEFGDEALAELAANLHEAVRVETEARRVLRSSQRTQDLATENLGDAQQAVADARAAIIKHITGGQA